MRYHEVIVVGGGLAGLRAAIAVNERNVSVAVLSKVHPLRSHTVAAQGGVNAPLGNHPRGHYDNWEKHAYDTIKGSDFLADQDAVVRMTKEASARILEMEHWGCPFSRTPEGKIAQRPFGGAGFPRTCYVADTTGHALLHTVYEQTVRFQQAAERKEMVLYPEWLITDLVVEGEECRGLVAMEMATGRLETFLAEAVIFATGGAGRLYGNSTNALINTGMGMAVPYWTGIPLKDMEFIQFHPTTLYGKNVLITEGARGEGGFLVNNKGERFLANYTDSRKAMEVAPRDIISRNMTKEIMEGRGFEGGYLHLDLRHLGREKILARLPGIREICLEFAGIDPIDEPIPVQPGQHYTLGGIDCNTECETRIKGFYAAGEAACVSVHGANRLGGNSLLETLVFGQIAGDRAAEYVQGKTQKESASGGKKALEEALTRTEEKIRKTLSSTGKEQPSKIRDEMQDLMVKDVGIFRNGKGLKEASEGLRDLKERYGDVKIDYKGRAWNQALAMVIELEGSLDVAEAVVAGAQAREESRGSHSRTDFTKRDDQNWLRHTLCFFTPEGPRLEYSEVRPGPFKIAERKY